MSFLLMVFLTLVCLYEGYTAPPWLATPGQSALVTATVVSLVGLHAFWVARRVSRPLALDPARREQMLGRYERWRFVHQMLQLGAYGLALTALGWGWTVRECWRWGGEPLPGLELWTLAPFLVGQVLTWMFFYDADRAAHRAANRLLDADGFGQAWLESRQAAAPAFGGRWSYVWFQLRQKLALVFIPVLLLIVQKELFRLLPSSWLAWQGLGNVLAVVVLIGIFVGMPLLIRLLLGLKPLPAGPLRDRLLATSRRLGMRCSDILLWNTRNGMANAMVIGLVPWLRYVVFTDRLIEEFSEEEVEAVFGHEIGHIRHRHMLFYLAFLMGSIMVLGFTAEYYLLPSLAQAGNGLSEWLPWLPSSLGERIGPTGDLALVPVVASLLAYVFLVFGFLSRRCERQADVFGCRAVSCHDPACEGHFEELLLPAGGGALCATGIRTFIRALEKVALVNGISRERPGFLQSWQHSTIARRVAFLRRVQAEAEVEAAFQRRLRWLKAGLMAALAVALAGLALRHWGL